MSRYETYDFAESLNGQSIAPTDIDVVIAAWGIHGDYAEWEGGFLMRLKDGRFAYLSGWCDTTGWGCQDGTNITFFQDKPELTGLEQSEYRDPVEWDVEPADLNRFVQGKNDVWDSPV